MSEDFKSTTCNVASSVGPQYYIFYDFSVTAGYSFIKDSFVRSSIVRFTSRQESTSQVIYFLLATFPEIKVKMGVAVERGWAFISHNNGFRNL